MNVEDILSTSNGTILDENQATEENLEIDLDDSDDVDTDPDSEEDIEN